MEASATRIKTNDSFKLLYFFKRLCGEFKMNMPAHARVWMDFGLLVEIKDWGPMRDNMTSHVPVTSLDMFQLCFRLARCQRLLVPQHLKIAKYLNIVQALLNIAKEHPNIA